MVFRAISVITLGLAFSALSACDGDALSPIKEPSSEVNLPEVRPEDPEDPVEDPEDPVEDPVDDPELPECDPCGVWSVAAELNEARARHTATKLDDGRVLIVGGESHGEVAALTVVEIFDPASDTITTVAPLNEGRYTHTATKLDDGRVLVAAGFGTFSYLSSVEIYDPVADTWTFFEDALSMPRGYHDAALLEDGRVIFLAGIGTEYPTHAEIFDPVSETTTLGAPLTPGRHVHTGSRLDDGSLLVVGGQHAADTLSASEAIDASGQTSSVGPSLPVAVRTHSATVLETGKLLVAGGYNGPVEGGATKKSFVLEDGLFVTTGEMVLRRFGHRATRLTDGRVLASGGLTTTGGPADNLPEVSSELFDPVERTWTLSGNMLTPRYGHSQTTLDDGRVLSCGGNNDDSLVANCEVWAW